MKKVVRDVLTVAAVVVGLIGLTLSFQLTVELQLILSLIILVFGLVYMGATWARAKGPEFEILELKKELVIETADGKNASLTRESKEVANANGLSEIWFRNFAATGEISDITIDGSPAKEGTSLFKELGLISLRKQLTTPFKKGETTTTTIKYSLIDSFPSEEEKLIHVVNHKTNKLKLVVILPTNRPAKSAQLLEVYGGTERIDRSDLLQKETPTRVEANLVDLKLGANYELKWTW
jgi:hypothetical protein